jgi:NhaA family Na+:H+ antiporter
LFGVGCLGGIGFTMSLFIAGLALEEELLDSAKIGTFAGSTISALAGYFLLLASLPSTGADDSNEEMNSEIENRESV